ncbi:TonB-dependent receptor [Halomonas llamarensis]|uniref:TonB-dependent receptor n=1 Tax=Halomonas llamarensis TaxID=2945104 RepID=A0ABT0STN2_9GAMM|nr:TonB-dependent receptor [Halomonas llamarensis]MCL7931194.1 TonB-dependent receptor [Halomonas llamarensis]
MSRRLLTLAPIAAAVLMATPAWGADHQHNHSGHDHDHHDHSSHDHAPEHADNGHNAQDFSLDISLTVEGIYHNRFSGEEHTPAGFGHGGHDDHGHDDHGHEGHAHALEDGFNLGHSEVVLQGRSHYLDGTAVVSLSEDDITLEEAYLSTRQLPANLTLKAGKFLSDVGYMNSRHPHAWDFIERPLVNQHILGEHGLLDTGVQLSWAPAANMQVGTELFQGEGEGFSQFSEGGFEAREDGPRVSTLFAKFQPDLGADQTLNLGASAGYNRQFVRVDDHGHHAHTAEGDNWFAGLDARYLRDGGQPGLKGDWQLGGEYFYTERDLREHVQHDDHFHARDAHTEQQDGAYLETTYGIAPSWQLGLRTEALGMSNRVMGTHPTTIVSEDVSWRHSGQLTWHLRSDMFLRAQVTQEDYADEEESWVGMLQFNATFGNHAGHNH